MDGKTGGEKTGGERMGAEHPNAQLARRAWDAIARGDAEALLEMLAPDLVWRATAQGTPWYGVHQGAEAAIDMLARVGETTDVFDADLVDILASDERVLVLFLVRIAVGGREVELDYLLLGRVVGDRIREIWTAALEPGRIEQFWRGDERVRR
jgi:ketosteroid isomerase-like protein